jgi:hypothetical protein
MPVLWNAVIPLACRAQLFDSLTPKFAAKTRRVQILHQIFPCMLTVVLTMSESAAAQACSRNPLRQSLSMLDANQNHSHMPFLSTFRTTCSPLIRSRIAGDGGTTQNAINRAIQLHSFQQSWNSCSADPAVGPSDRINIPFENNGRSKPDHAGTISCCRSRVPRGRE